MNSDVDRISYFRSINRAPAHRVFECLLSGYQNLNRINTDFRVTLKAYNTAPQNSYSVSNKISNFRLVQ